MKDIVREISRYCQAQGENTKSIWEEPLLSALHGVPNATERVNRVKRTLGFVEVRVHSGEPIAFKKDGDWKVNPVFTTHSILHTYIDPSAREVIFEGPVSPESRSYWQRFSEQGKNQRLILDSSVYEAEKFDRDFSLRRCETIIQNIADNADSRCRNDKWMTRMKNKAQDIKDQDKKLPKWLRTNLLNVALRVSNGELLYHPDDIFNSEGMPIITNEVSATVNDSSQL
ncbi:hypothetical protein JCM16303_000817 [Sporobolomyces ruberrimus]